MATEEKQKQNLTETQEWNSYVISQIHKIAAGANVQISKETQAVYAEQLSRLTKAQLSLAVQRTIIEWDKPSMMPTLKFILERSGHSPPLKAERDYWEVMRAFDRWHPDIGNYPQYLSSAAQYALRQIGGFHRIAQTRYADMDFQRKAFMEAHQRYTAEDGAQVYLSANEAKAFLESLSKEVPTLNNKVPQVPHEKASG